MVNPELLNYVRGQIGASVPRDQIRKALATGGWTELDANDAFAVIDGVRTAPTAPPVPPPPATSTGVNPNYQPQPAMAAPMRPPMQSVSQQPVMTSPIAMRKRRHIPWGSIMTLLVVAVLGVLAYVAFPWVEAQYNAYMSAFTTVPSTQDNKIPPSEVGTTTASTTLNTTLTTPTTTPTTTVH